MPMHHEAIISRFSAQCRGSSQASSRLHSSYRCFPCDSVFPCVSEKCPQLGYPVPVAGNDLCPMLKEEEQCTSEVTESQLAEGTVRCDCVIMHVRY